jgi:hypothetical protein
VAASLFAGPSENCSSTAVLSFSRLQRVVNSPLPTSVCGGSTFQFQARLLREPGLFFVSRGLPLPFTVYGGTLFSWPTPLRCRGVLQGYFRLPPQAIPLCHCRVSQKVPLPGVSPKLSKVRRNGFCFATALHANVALPFVIPSAADLSRRAVEGSAVLSTCIWRYGEPLLSPLSSRAQPTCPGVPWRDLRFSQPAF